jgi:general secretion pathway protein A
VLEELRLLSDIEAEQSKLLQIVLIGQSELRRTLRRASVTGLRQRIVLAHDLERLSRAEIHRYILHRMEVASAPRSLVVRFEEAALGEIDELSAGLPRRINIVADGALLVAFVRGTHLIDHEVVRTASENLLIDEEPTDQRSVLKAA